MSDGPIGYDYSVLSEACNQLLKITQQIQHATDDLIKQVEQNVSLYLSGDSANQYQLDAKAINQDFTDTATYLMHAAQSVSQGADDMRLQDRRLASGFGG